MQEIDLKVVAVQSLTPLIKRFKLRAANGGALPAFAPGAHLSLCLELEDGVCERHYSLIDLHGDPAGHANPQAYTIAVRLEEDSSGGSHYMHHAVDVGSRLQAQGPINEFPLGMDAGRCVMFAGGIGITPLISMAAALRNSQQAFRFHYSGRSRTQLALVDELSAIAGDQLAIHADDEPDSCLDVATLLADYAPADHIYVCGPKGMIDAVIDGAKSRGWPQEHIHSELFSTVRPDEGDGAFEVECRESGITVHVPADKSILEVLVEAGVDPLCDCERGECGVCSTPVLEGEVDHRDYYLSDEEKASNEVMQICVSRAKGDRLVLDV